MANLKETPKWEEGIYQFEQTDWLSAGEDGLDNVPLRQLANRTLFLKNDTTKMRSDMDRFIQDLNKKFDQLKKEADAKIKEAIEYSKGILPIGTVMSYPVYKGKSFGQWHICDGSQYDTTKYIELLKILNTNKLPNLTKNRLFIRSCGANGEGIGTEQSDAIRNITGSFSGRGLFYNNSYGTNLGTKGVFTSYDSGYESHNDEGYKSDSGIKFDASRVVPTADENRPKNITMAFYIKMI